MCYHSGHTTLQCFGAVIAKFAVDQIGYCKFGIQCKFDNDNRESSAAPSVTLHCASKHFRQQQGGVKVSFRN